MNALRRTLPGTASRVTTAAISIPPPPLSSSRTVGKIVIICTIKAVNASIQPSAILVRADMYDVRTYGLGSMRANTDTTRCDELVSIEGSDHIFGWLECADNEKSA